MAATQHSEYSASYYNQTYQHVSNTHQNYSQYQNYYSSGQYECNKSNANAYNNNNYQTNYNHWHQQQQNFNGDSGLTTNHPQQEQLQQQSQMYHHQYPQNMLSNHTNDDYLNYSHNSNLQTNRLMNIYNNQTTQQHYNQYPSHNINSNRSSSKNNEIKTDFCYQEPHKYPQQVPSLPPVQKEVVPTQSKVETSRKKRKLETQPEDDSPALRALLTNPVKKPKYTSSPYFYQAYGNLSPSSSIDAKSPYPTHPKEVLSPTRTEDNLEFPEFNQRTTKDGYESSIKESTSNTVIQQQTAASFPNSPVSSFIENCIATPPSSPKDTSFDLTAHSAESAENFQWIPENEACNGRCHFIFKSVRGRVFEFTNF